MPAGTLVIGEATEEGKLNPVVPELIGIGSRLGGPVTVALLGSGVEGLAGEAGAFGANKVIVVDDAILKEYQGDAYAPVAERIAKDQVKREAKWTESLAVGSQSFVENLERRIRNRQQTEMLSEGQTWVLRENYGPVFEDQNRAIAACGAIKYR